MNRFTGLLTAAAVVLCFSLFADEAAAQARGKKKPGIDYTPQYDDYGNPIVPKDAEGQAKHFIWSKDAGQKDAKLSAEEAALAPKTFGEIDTNRDGFLDLKELTYYIKSKMPGGAGKEAPAEEKKKKK